MMNQPTDDKSPLPKSGLSLGSEPLEDVRDRRFTTRGKPGTLGDGDSTDDDATDGDAADSDGTDAGDSDDDDTKDADGKD
jgi:hypothetical protein